MGLGQIPAGGGGTPPVADTTLKRLALTPDALAGSSALSALSITQTLNTSGSPVIFDVDVTDTASGAGTLLARFRTGGSTKFSVRKDGYTQSAFGFAADSWYNLGGGAWGSIANIGVGFGMSFVSGFAISRDVICLRAAAATLQLGNNHATTATTQTIKAHDVTAGKGAGLDLVGGSSGNGANSGDVRMMAGTAEGVKVYHDETAGAAGIGFFGVGGTLRPTTAFSGVTFLPGMGTQVTEDATFGGYTLAQVVSALQALGLLS